MAAQVAATADRWRVLAPAAGLWVLAAAKRSPAGPARWVLEYDPGMSLLSFEVWADGNCVFGIDDFIGATAVGPAVRPARSCGPAASSDLTHGRGSRTSRPRLPAVNCDLCGQQTPLSDAVGTVGSQLLRCRSCAHVLLDQTRPLPPATASGIEHG